MTEERADEIARYIAWVIETERDRVRKITYGGNGSGAEHITVYLDNQWPTERPAYTLPGVSTFYTGIEYYASDAAALSRKWVVLFDAE